jgi:hypothetical protein
MEAVLTSPGASGKSEYQRADIPWKSNRAGGRFMVLYVASIHDCINAGIFLCWTLYLSISIFNVPHFMLLILININIFLSNFTVAHFGNAPR